MEQWNENFVRYHLQPFLERVLVDMSKGEKPYLRAFILKTDRLTPQERDDFENDYFEGNANDTVTPFTRPDQQEEREAFIEYLHQQIRNFGADPLQRARAILPLQDKENKQTYHFPPNVSRNLFFMAYGIARDFEKAEISRRIDEKARNDARYKEAAKDRRLNATGQLMLVAKAPKLSHPTAPRATDTKSTASKTFSHFLKKADLKAEEKAEPFLTPDAAKHLRESAEKNAEITITFPESSSVATLVSPATTPATPAVTASNSALPAIAKPSIPPGEISSLAAADLNLHGEENTFEAVSAHDMADEMAVRSQEALGSNLEEFGLQAISGLTFRDGQASMRVSWGTQIVEVTLVTAVPIGNEYRYLFEFQNDPLHRQLALSESQLEACLFTEDGTPRSFAEIQALMLQEFAHQRAQKIQAGLASAQNTETKKEHEALPFTKNTPDAASFSMPNGLKSTAASASGAASNGSAPMASSSAPSAARPFLIKDQSAPAGVLAANILKNVQASKRRHAARRRTALAQANPQPITKNAPTQARNALASGKTTAPNQTLAARSTNPRRSKPASKFQKYFAPALIAGTTTAAVLTPTALGLLTYLLKINGVH